MSVKLSKPTSGKFLSRQFSFRLSLGAKHFKSFCGQFFVFVKLNSIAQLSLSVLRPSASCEDCI